MTFEEVKADYVKLINEYGYPYDMTGGFVDSEQMEKVILNPTKTNAKQYMKNVINYGFQWGRFWKAETGKTSIHGDLFLEKCYSIYS